MAGGNKHPVGVHLVGAINLDPVAEVFSSVAGTLGGRLRRLPDGEPGARRLWVSYQYPLLRAKTFLRPNPDAVGRKTLFTTLELADDPDENVRFGELGYAREARASYIEFCEARDRGEIPAGCRFQVCLPTPLAIIYSFVSPGSLPVVEKAYEAAMLAEVERMGKFIPHEDLAIQWDVCHEMIFWDGQIMNRKENPWHKPFDDLEAGIVERLKRISAAVPNDIELGYHLCYGDLDHKHFVEPQDATKMTELANAISKAVTRPIAFIHMPVPRGRTDDAFFAPLAKLALHPETELYLGLVHHSDGVAGTERRIAAAQKFVPEFGVATECGMGRRAGETIRELLKIHAAVSDPAPR